MSESNIKNMDSINDIKSTVIGKNKKILEFGASDDSTAEIFKRNKCTIRQFELDSVNVNSLNTKKLFGDEKFDVMYSCLRCGTKVSNSELSKLPEIKCICGFRVFIKVRPPIVKTVKAI